MTQPFDREPEVGGQRQMVKLSRLTVYNRTEVHWQTDDLDALLGINAEPLCQCYHDQTNNKRNSNNAPGTTGEDSDDNADGQELPRQKILTQ